MTNLQLRIKHYYHSGFSAACGDLLFVFDYWRGENGELTTEHQITPRFLRSFRHVYVFISHEHPDHMDPIVFTWKNIARVTYIVSSDMPVGTRGRRMAPGQRMILENNIYVTAYESTDLGVSFLLDLNGIHLFHAGDLNFWHWREESTLQEIEEADQEFRRAVQPLSQVKIDVAFFPVDPRQGSMFEAGANYFILSVKPRLLIPMHYFMWTDIILDYARTASCRSTEVLAMPGLGDAIDLSFDEKGYMDISFPKEEVIPEEQGEEDKADLEELIAENPFDESDLPLSQLAQEEEDYVLENVMDLPAVENEAAPSTESGEAKEQEAPESDTEEKAEPEKQKTDRLDPSEKEANMEKTGEEKEPESPEK